MLSLYNIICYLILILSNIDSFKPVSPDIISITINHKDKDLIVNNHDHAVSENTLISLNENNAMTSSISTTINHKDKDPIVNNHDHAVSENTLTSLNENNAMTSSVATSILFKML